MFVVMAYNVNALRGAPFVVRLEGGRFMVAVAQVLPPRLRPAYGAFARFIVGALAAIVAVGLGLAVLRDTAREFSASQVSAVAARFDDAVDVIEMINDVVDIRPHAVDDKPSDQRVPARGVDLDDAYASECALYCICMLTLGVLFFTQSRTLLSSSFTTQGSSQNLDQSGIMRTTR
jgi:hypothetical protein